MSKANLTMPNISFAKPNRIIKLKDLTKHQNTTVTRAN